MGGTGGYQDLSDFESVPPKMGGTQHPVKKDGTPQNGGYWGVPKGYSFQMGGTSTPHSGRATVHP